MQPACTMTTQNSKIRLISSTALFEVKVDNLLINLKLRNLIGQFELVIVQAGCTPRAWCVTYTYSLHI